MLLPSRGGTPPSSEVRHNLSLVTALLVLPAESMQVLVPAIVHIRGTVSMTGGHLFAVQIADSILIVNLAMHTQIAFRIVLVS